MNDGTKPIIFVLLPLCAALISYILTSFSNANIPPSNPNVNLPNEMDLTRLLIQLNDGEEAIDFSILDGTLEFIANRYDRLDFRFPTLIRIIYEYEDKLPAIYQDKIKQTLLNTKYWMDEKGDDSICFWSENHQILFSSAEYLVAQYYYNDNITFNNGQETFTADERIIRAKQRILQWLELRFVYGFSEWYSQIYYIEDIAPLAVLIDFVNDTEIQIKSSMILDLLLFDIASQSFNGKFVTTSGRLYEPHKKGINWELIHHANKNNLNGYVIEDTSILRPQHRMYYERTTDRIIQYLWPDLNYNITPLNNYVMDINLIYCKKYKMPNVIKEIGYDNEETIIKASNGLYLNELEKQHLFGIDNKHIMMLWGMEAFVNPEICELTLKYIEKHNLWKNEFLNGFNVINFGNYYINYVVFKLSPLIVYLLNFKEQGTVMQRANTYTFKNKYFSMSTAQKYQFNQFGDQQHLWQATFSKYFSIFTTHPATSLGEGALSLSPGYWVGNHMNPFVVQNKNINICIYILDFQQISQKNMANFSHAYFPTTYFDKIQLEDNYMFGKYGNVFVAMIGKHHLSFKPNSDHNDLLQFGQKTWWITEISDIENDKSFYVSLKPIFLNNSINENYYIAVNSDFYWKRIGNIKIVLNNSINNGFYNIFNIQPSGFNRKYSILSNVFPINNNYITVNETWNVLLFPINNSVFFTTNNNIESTSEILNVVNYYRNKELMFLMKYNNLNETKLAIQSVLMNNFIYSPEEGPFGLISRGPGWIGKSIDFDFGFVLFDWDNIF
eukprot:53617_1